MTQDHPHQALDWQQPLSPRELDLLLSEPPEHPPHWGYYVFLGLGFGYFQWFDTQAQMLQSLTQVEPLHAPSEIIHPERYAEIRAALSALARRWEQRELSTEELCTAMNPLFVECEILWLGPIEELLQGMHPLAQKLRADFGSGPLMRVSPDFLAFLEQYDKPGA